MSHLDEISAIIRRVEAAAEKRGYERGLAEAKQALIAQITAFGAAPKEQDAPKRNVTEIAIQERSSDRPAVQRQRAPKGIVGRFVTQVLSNEPGLSAKEIGERAETEFERMIKPGSIRGELRNGSKSGKYRTQDGKWFLSVEAGGQSLVGQPPASNHDQGDDDAAALI